MRDGLAPVRVRVRCGMAQFSVPIEANSIQTIVQPISFNTNEMANIRRWMVVVLAIGATVASTGCISTEEPVLTFSGSVVGREADVIRRQLERFGRAHPSIKVALRATPDAADQRQCRHRPASDTRRT